MIVPHAVLRALLLLAPGLAFAQAAPSGPCRFIFDNTPTTRLVLSKLPSGQYNSFMGGGVIARCPAKKLVLRADSLESWGDEGRLYLVGHVDYREPRLALKSEFLTYYQRDEHLIATQNVDATLPSGSNLKGPQLDFYRAIPRVRPRQSATATGRPTIRLVQRDSAGRPQPPVNVTGNTVFLQGDSVISAVGQVVVVRPELTATGDSLYADDGAGLVRLMRTPKIVGTKGRPFTLIGETIDLLTKRRKLDRVLAKNGAEAQSEDLVLRSDSMDLRVSNDLLQRAYAWGKSRARATSPTQSIVSDSIDVLMPNQRVRELHALRGAVAEGTPDTTKFRTKERDRLTGDTIVAHFDTLPARDTASKPRIRMLVSTGNATSLNHYPPRDTTVCVPAVVYVRGRIITVHFDSAKVREVAVTDKAGGVQLDPDPADSANLCRVIAVRGLPAQQPAGTARPASTTPPAAPAAPAGTPPASAPAPAPAPVAAPPASAPPPKRP